MDIIKELDEYCTGVGANSESAELLKHKMRYCHIWMPPGKRKLYEDQKRYTSTNTAAVKHILLGIALVRTEALLTKKNTDLVIQLVQMVFKNVVNPSQFSSPHALLRRTTIPHLSVLASATAKKTQLGLDT